MIDRHTRTKQELPPIYDVIARIEKALQRETPGSAGYQQLQTALEYWETRERDVSRIIHVR